MNDLDMDMDESNSGYKIPNEDLHLELINNISSMFQDLDSRHAETRKILDFLCLWIHKKLGELPPEITKLLVRQPIVPKINRQEQLPLLLPLSQQKCKPIAPAPVVPVILKVSSGPTPGPAPATIHHKPKPKPKSRAGPLCSKIKQQQIIAAAQKSLSTSSQVHNSYSQFYEESSGSGSNLYEESESLEQPQPQTFKILESGAIVPKTSPPKRTYIIREDEEEESQSFFQPPDDEEELERNGKSEESKDPDYDPRTSEKRINHNHFHAIRNCASGASTSELSGAGAKSPIKASAAPVPVPSSPPRRINGVYHCNYCPKFYKDRSGWLRHHWGHTGEKPYKCRAAGCDEAFRHPTARKIHYHRAHIMIPPLKAGPKIGRFEVYRGLPTNVSNTVSGTNTTKFRAKISISGNNASISAANPSISSTPNPIASDSPILSSVLTGTKSSNSSATFTFNSGPNSSTSGAIANASDSPRFTLVSEQNPSTSTNSIVITSVSGANSSSASTGIEPATSNSGSTATVIATPKTTPSPSKKKKRRFRSSRTQRIRKLSVPCPHCTRKFASQQILQYHIYSHTGEKPFICQFCQTAYNQPSNLRRHIRNQHHEENLKFQLENPEAFKQQQQQLQQQENQAENPQNDNNNDEDFDEECELFEVENDHEDDEDENDEFEAEDTEMM